MSKLVVKLTFGVDEAAERANQALTVAATAIAAGADVSLWLTGEAAWLAVRDAPTGTAIPHAVPAADLVAAVVAGGRVTLCSQCALRRNLTQADLLDGVRIAGAASYVDEVLAPDARALVY